MTWEKKAQGSASSPIVVSLSLSPAMPIDDFPRRGMRRTRICNCLEAAVGLIDRWLKPGRKHDLGRTRSCIPRPPQSGKKKRETCMGLVHATAGPMLHLLVPAVASHFWNLRGALNRQLIFFRATLWLIKLRPKCRYLVPSTGQIPPIEINSTFICHGSLKQTAEVDRPVLNFDTQQIEQAAGIRWFRDCFGQLVKKVENSRARRMHLRLLHHRAQHASRPLMTEYLQTGDLDLGPAVFYRPKLFRRRHSRTNACRSSPTDRTKVTSPSISISTPSPWRKHQIFHSKRLGPLLPRFFPRITLSVAYLGIRV